MKARLWEVKFEDWSSANINAKDIFQALEKAKKLKDFKEHEITEVTLIVEED